MLAWHDGAHSTSGTRASARRRPRDNSWQGSKIRQVIRRPCQERTNSRPRPTIWRAGSPSSPDASSINLNGRLKLKCSHMNQTLTGIWKSWRTVETDIQLRLIGPDVDHFSVIAGNLIRWNIDKHRIWEVIDSMKGGARVPGSWLSASCTNSRISTIFIRIFLKVDWPVYFLDSYLSSRIDKWFN